MERENRLRASFLRLQDECDIAGRILAEPPGCVFEIGDDGDSAPERRLRVFRRESVRDREPRWICGGGFGNRDLVEPRRTPRAGVHPRECERLCGGKCGRSEKNDCFFHDGIVKVVEMAAPSLPNELRGETRISTSPETERRRLASLHTVGSLARLLPGDLWQPSSRT